MLNSLRSIWLAIVNDTIRRSSPPPRPFAEPPRPDMPISICEGCGYQIDPETCGCGDPIEGHGYAPGHGPIPMGCDCYRDRGTDQSTAPDSARASNE